MTLSRCLFAGLLLIVAAPLQAAEPQDPLRLIPDKANLVIKVEKPRQFIEAILNQDIVKEAERLDIIRQLLDSAQARRIFEFIAYAERDLGVKWPELLDKLAGGGVALGTTIQSDDDSPVLLVIQGTDEALAKKFVDRASALFEAIAGGPDAKDKVTKENYKKLETLHFGSGLHACRIDSALLVSNKLETLKAGIDQHWSNQTKGAATNRSLLEVPNLQKARKLLPANPLVWLWYDLAYLKTLPGAKDVLTSPRDNIVFTFIAAGILDIVRRSDFVAAGFYETKEGFNISLRMPAGRDGMADDVELHLPRDAKTPGSLPLLESKGVLFSHSFYLDLNTLYAKRDKVMSGQSAKDFDAGVKQVSRVLVGTSLEKLFSQMGPHHRLVAVQRPLTAGYSIEPQVRIPAFAYIASMRDPKFGKSLETLIRGGMALGGGLGGFTTKLVEGKHGDVSYFGYRFPENGKFPDDPQGIRFNFTPTAAAVGDQFIVASTQEFCLELIDYLKKEDRSKLITHNMQMRGFAEGVGAYLNYSPELLLTQTILNQAISEADAKKQVDQLLKYINKLGSVQIGTDYTSNEFHFDIRWRFKTKQN